MSQLLVNRIRKNREFKKEIVDPKSGRTFTFTCRRPTDHEAGELRAAGRADDCEVAQRFVVGWDGVTEDDVAGNANTGAVAFDTVLWREWCADRVDFWAPLAQAVADAYKAHTEEMEQAAKNSSSGSNNAA